MFEPSERVKRSATKRENVASPHGSARASPSKQNLRRTKSKKSAERRQSKALTSADRDATVERMREEMKAQANSADEGSDNEVVQTEKNKVKQEESKKGQISQGTLQRAQEELEQDEPSFKKLRSGVMTNSQKYFLKVKSGGEDGRSRSKTKAQLQQLNQDPQFRELQSLNARALEMVQTRDYLYKVKQIKAGNGAIKQMEFIMDGLRIQLPFTGHKVTQGYLKKETAKGNLLIAKQFQMRYCILDLTKFQFKYAKSPTETFTTMQLKDIIDIQLEQDPAATSKERSFFGKKKDNGFNYVICSTARNFRMQANTKVEQLMWAKAFTILFELRARVSQNLKTTIDINEFLGIRAGQTMTINNHSDDGDEEHEYNKKQRSKKAEEAAARKKSEAKPPQAKLRGSEDLASKLKAYSSKMDVKKSQQPAATGSRNANKDLTLESLSSHDIENENIEIGQGAQKSSNEKGKSMNNTNINNQSVSDIGMLEDPGPLEEHKEHEEVFRSLSQHATARRERAKSNELAQQSESLKKQRTQILEQLQIKKQLLETTQKLNGLKERQRQIDMLTEEYSIKTTEDLEPAAKSISAVEPEAASHIAGYQFHEKPKADDYYDEEEEEYDEEIEIEEKKCGFKRASPTAKGKRSPPKPAKTKIMKETRIIEEEALPERTPEGTPAPKSSRRQEEMHRLEKDINASLEKKERVQDKNPPRSEFAALRKLEGLHGSKQRDAAPARKIGNFTDPQFEGATRQQPYRGQSQFTLKPSSALSSPRLGEVEQAYGRPVKTEAQILQRNEITDLTVFEQTTFGLQVPQFTPNHREHHFDEQTPVEVVTEPVEVLSAPSRSVNPYSPLAAGDAQWTMAQPSNKINYGHTKSQENSMLIIETIHDEEDELVLESFEEVVENDDPPIQLLTHQDSMNFFQSNQATKLEQTHQQLPNLQELSSPVQPARLPAFNPPVLAADEYLEIEITEELSEGSAGDPALSVDEEIEEEIVEVDEWAGIATAKSKVMDREGERQEVEPVANRAEKHEFQAVEQPKKVELLLDQWGWEMEESSDGKDPKLQDSSEQFNTNEFLSSEDYGAKPMGSVPQSSLQPSANQSAQQSQRQDPNKDKQEQTKAEQKIEIKFHEEIIRKLPQQEPVNDYQDLNPQFLDNSIENFVSYQSAPVRQKKEKPVRTRALPPKNKKASNLEVNRPQMIEINDQADIYQPTIDHDGSPVFNQRKGPAGYSNISVFESKRDAHPLSEHKRRRDDEGNYATANNGTIKRTIKLPPSSRNKLDEIRKSVQSNLKNHALRMSNHQRNFTNSVAMSNRDLMRNFIRQSRSRAMNESVRGEKLRLSVTRNRSLFSGVLSDNSESVTLKSKNSKITASGVRKVKFTHESKHLIRQKRKEWELSSHGMSQLDNNLNQSDLMNVTGLDISILKDQRPSMNKSILSIGDGSFFDHNQYRKQLNSKMPLHPRANKSEMRQTHQLAVNDKNIVNILNIQKGDDLMLLDENNDDEVNLDDSESQEEVRNTANHSRKNSGALFNLYLNSETFENILSNETNSIRKKDNKKKLNQHKVLNSDMSSQSMSRNLGGIQHQPTPATSSNQLPLSSQHTNNRDLESQIQPGKHNNRNRNMEANAQISKKTQNSKNAGINSKGFGGGKNQLSSSNYVDSRQRPQDRQGRKAPNKKQLNLELNSNEITSGPRERKSQVPQGIQPQPLVGEVSARGRGEVQMGGTGNVYNFYNYFSVPSQPPSRRPAQIQNQN